MISTVCLINHDNFRAKEKLAYAMFFIFLHIESLFLKFFYFQVTFLSFFNNIN